MQAESKQVEASFQRWPSAVVLSEIFAAEISVAVWQRSANRVVEGYFQAVSNHLKLGVRQVLPVATLKEDLTTVLPDALGKQQAIDDVFLLADMLTCLFDCQEVGLRLTSVDRAMCPRFHVDNIPVRLITTYCGEGTQWLPNEHANTEKLGHGAKGLDDSASGLYADESQVCQMQRFDVGLLKGAVFNPSHWPAIHRSCPVAAGQKRVLLTMDPI